MLNIDIIFDIRMTTLQFVMFLFCSLTSAMGGGPQVDYPCEFYTFLSNLC